MNMKRGAQDVAGPWGGGGIAPGPQGPRGLIPPSASRYGGLIG